jgi:cold shock CspA family protein
MQLPASGIVFLTAAIVFLSSCSGYRLGAAKPEIFTHIETLAIPTFVNETLEPRLAVPMTNATIKAFMSDGTYRIAQRDDADAALIVKIRKIDRSSFRSLRGNQLVSRELDFSVSCDFYVEDLRTGDVLLTGSASGDSNLGVLGNNFQLAERQALSDASRMVATEIMSKICEGW